jgi:8-oxo-dGTP diphosphatase
VQKFTAQLLIIAAGSFLMLEKNIIWKYNIEMIEVVAAIIKKDGKILIARRKKGSHMEGMWEFPGGKIEVGETPQQCLERELKEEFEIICKAGEFVAESIFNYGIKVVKLSGYFAEHLDGEFVLNDHSEIKWVTPGEFSDFEFAPADIPIANKLMNNI